MHKMFIVMILFMIANINCSIQVSNFSGSSELSTDGDLLAEFATEKGIYFIKHVMPEVATK